MTQDTSPGAFRIRNTEMHSRLRHGRLHFGGKFVIKLQQHLREHDQVLCLILDYDLDLVVGFVSLCWNVVHATFDLDKLTASDKHPV
jgi:hypothetical protein